MFLLNVTLAIPIVSLNRKLIHPSGGGGGGPTRAILHEGVPLYMLLMYEYTYIHVLHTVYTIYSLLCK